MSLITDGKKEKGASKALLDGITEDNVSQKSREISEGTWVGTQPVNLGVFKGFGPRELIRVIGFQHKKSECLHQLTKSIFQSNK